MAKRIYREIVGYLSYKYFDRTNREFWVKRYKDRTGSDTARGWNHSPEYLSYLKSARSRILKFAERAPRQFFDKAKYVLKHSMLDEYKEESYNEETKKAMSFLNPMVGEWGLSQLIEQMKMRGIIHGKRAIVIAKVTAPKILLPNSPEIVKNLTESRLVRDEMMKNFGQLIANKNKEKYKDSAHEMLGADYILKVFTTGYYMFATIEANIFIY